MSGLQLKNIKKKYRDTEILSDFSLDIKPEEFVVLVGPSGSGKSTIIRVIAGLEEKQAGTITLDDTDIGNLSPKDRNLSMVFQNYALYPHKSVFDNIAFPLKMEKQLNDSEIEKRVHDVASKLNIEDYLKRKPKELSGGQRQRVALARAMIKNPKLFLMDEPLSNLDAKLRAQMRTEINHLHKESACIFIYVTHDQVEALTLGDRIVVLNYGEIQQAGSPHEIYTNPQNTFVASFIGSPPTNLMEASDHILGIRPEFLYISKNKAQEEITGSEQIEEIEVEVKNIELLGGEYLVYGDLKDSRYVFFSHKDEKDSNNKRIIARLVDSEEIRALYDEFQKSQSANLNKMYYHKSKAYSFDKESQKRINIHTDALADKIQVNL